MPEDSLPLIGAFGGQCSSEIGGTAPPPAAGPAVAVAEALAEALGLAVESPPKEEVSQACPSLSASRPFGSVGSLARVSCASSWLEKSEQSRSPEGEAGAVAVAEGDASDTTPHPTDPSPMPLPWSASWHCCSRERPQIPSLPALASSWASANLSSDPLLRRDRVDAARQRLDRQTWELAWAEA